MVHPTWSKRQYLPTAHRVPLAPMAGQRRWSRPWRGATDEPWRKPLPWSSPRTPRTGTPRAKFWTRPWRQARKHSIGHHGHTGVGKSSFIESFGLHVIEQGRRVAVLAVDPSSPRSGGSILGDKIRMEMLGRNPGAFTSLPIRRNLGGVARRTREAAHLCEAAGFDVVIVETVGVGQSETAVSEMVDMFLLLLAPGGGDELQGIKKGIVELAGPDRRQQGGRRLGGRRRTGRQDYANALRLLKPPSRAWTPRGSEMLRARVQRDRRRMAGGFKIERRLNPTVASPPNEKHRTGPGCGMKSPKGCSTG